MAARSAQATRPPAGTLLDLRVDDLAQGGAGIARHNGYVVFVEGGLPGDLVRAEVVKAKRDYARARVADLIEPSSERVAERCEHDGLPCPGSPWQALRYERQLEHKQRQVDEALSRLGGLSGYELEPIIPAVEIWRYRNKLEYSFGEKKGPSAGKPAAGFVEGGRDEGSLVLGFHQRGHWEQIVDAHDCMLASERNNAVRNLVRDWFSTQDSSAYDRRTGQGFLRNLVVREGQRTGALQVRLVTAAGDLASGTLAAALA